MPKHIMPPFVCQVIYVTEQEYAEMAKTAVPVLARLPVEIPENGILNGRQATLFAATVDE